VTTRANVTSALVTIPLRATSRRSASRIRLASATGSTILRAAYRAGWQRGARLENDRIDLRPREVRGEISGLEIRSHHRLMRSRLAFTIDDGDQWAEDCV
jgi:hypothetical protein